MNSSILPELSMGEPPVKDRRDEPLRGNNRSLGPTESSRRSFKAELRSGCLQSRSVVLWLDVFPLVLSLRCVHSRLSLSSPHRPAPAHPGAQTRCCRCCRGSDRRGRDASSLPLVSGTLTVPSGALVSCKTVIFVPITHVWGQARPLCFHMQRHDIISFDPV